MEKNSTNYTSLSDSKLFGLLSKLEGEINASGGLSSILIAMRGADVPKKIRSAYRASIEHAYIQNELQRRQTARKTAAKTSAGPVWADGRWSDEDDLDDPPFNDLSRFPEIQEYVIYAVGKARSARRARGISDIEPS